MLRAILLLHILATPAHQAKEAEERVHASMTDYDMGHFEQALREAEEAYRLDPRPQILYNMAQCHRGLHHWDQAAYLYQRYLAKLPDAPNRKSVEGLLAEVQQQLKAEQAKTSAVEAAPQGVVVVSPLPPPPLVLTPLVAAPLVETPAAKPPVTKDASAPPAAIGPGVEKSAEPRHSHAAAYVLGSAALVSLVVMVIGIVYVENFEAVLGRLNSSKVESYAAWQADQATAASQQPHAQVWEWVAGATGAVAAVTGTSAVLTW